MTDRYRKTKHALWAISEEIYEYAYDHYSLPSEWESSEVSISATPRAGSAKSDAERLTIVTSAAPEIAWLFGRLRDAFATLGNGVLGDWLYMRLGRVARAHELTSDRQFRVNSILRAVMNEAFAILDEMEKGEFEPPASIAEIDLALVRKPQGNHSGQAAVFC